MISPGVVHAVPRTVAMAPFVEEVDFVDFTGTADRAPLTRAGVRYHTPSEGGTSRIRSLNLRRLLARLAPDVIVCHYGSGDHFFNAIAYGRCPVAVIAMGNDVLYEDGDTRVSPLRGLLTRMGLRRAAFISAKSRFLAEALRGLGVRARTEINYWGADLKRFSPGDAAAARRTLGLPAGVPIVLSPRAIEPRLNVHLVVEAFAEVVKHRPEAELVILGRSMPQYRAEVAAAVAHLALAGRVRVLGEVGQEALPDWYRASDVVVSVASVEGFPNTVLEAMACAVPVLVGDIPQVRELLTDGVNARISTVEASAIARGIEEVLADRQRALAIAEKGRKTALEWGDIDTNGRRFAEAMRHVVESGGDVSGAPPLPLFRAVLGSYIALKRWLPDVC